MCIQTQYRFSCLLHAGNQLYRSGLQIVKNVAAPSWITGEATGWCVNFYYLVCLRESNTTGHHDLSSYTPSNRDMLPQNIPPHLVLAILGC